MEEENPKSSMAETSKILRKSIYIFLQNYHYFTSIAAIVAFPFTSSVLITESFIPSFPTSRSLLQTTFERLNTLFESAGFPHSSPLFNIFSFKLSQAIVCYIFTLPFTLIFSLLAKATVIRFLNNLENPFSPPSFSSIIYTYIPLLKTYICNSFLLFSVNVSTIALFFLMFNLLEWSGISSPQFFLFMSAVAAIMYSIVLANSLVLCNFAMVLSGTDRSTSGFLAILKAYILMNGKSSIAISLALPVSFGIAGIEALFRCRIASGERLSGSMGLEGVLIGYLYAAFVVLDTIITWVFLKFCKDDYEVNDDEEEFYLCKTEGGNYVKLIDFEEIP